MLHGGGGRAAVTHVGIAFTVFDSATKQENIVVAVFHEQD